MYQVPCTRYPVPGTSAAIGWRERPARIHLRLESLHSAAPLVVHTPHRPNRASDRIILASGTGAPGRRTACTTRPVQGERETGPPVCRCWSRFGGRAVDQAALLWARVARTSEMVVRGVPPGAVELRSGRVDVGSASRRASAKVDARAGSSGSAGRNAPCIFSGRTAKSFPFRQHRLRHFANHSVSALPAYTDEISSMLVSKGVPQESLHWLDKLSALLWQEAGQASHFPLWQIALVRAIQIVGSVYLAYAFEKIVGYAQKKYAEVSPPDDMAHAKDDGLG